MESGGKAVTGEQVREWRPRGCLGPSQRKEAGWSTEIKSNAGPTSARGQRLGDC